MNLAGFSQLSPQKVEGTAAKAAAKVQTVASKYNIEPTAVTKAARLAFYNFILLCGMSGLSVSSAVLQETLTEICRWQQLDEVRHAHSDPPN